jgi:hypothetical protein
MVHEVFHEAYEHGVKLVFVEQPSFQPELAVFLKQDSGKFQIVTLQPTIQLWAYEGLAMAKRGEIMEIKNHDWDRGVRPDKDIAELEARLPRDFHDVPVKRCQAEVDTGTANRLTSVWRSMLLETRYTQPPEQGVIVTDGVEYHYSMPGDVEFMTGWTAGAPEGGRLEALGNISDAMRDYCAKPSNDSLTILNSDTGKLEAMLQNRLLHNGHGDNH